MIKVDHLTKYYGEHLAVDDLSFEIPNGRVYGFLGPNGAGKSTTMNIITGCLSATEGKVLIDEHDIFEEPEKAKQLIGYLPEQPPLYQYESPYDYLTFVGRAKGLRGKELDTQIERVLEETGIEHIKNKRISSLSKGYKQRVGIAQAILGNPGLIILDEPTVGLDPLQIIEIRDLIKTLGKEHTVIFSSHILSEVQEICDEILVISKGKLVAFDTAQNLEKKLLGSNELIITAEAQKESVESILTGLPEITEIVFSDDSEPYLHIRLTTQLDDIYALSKAVYCAFAQAGLVLLEMKLKKATLEDVFIELTEDEPINLSENGKEEES